MERSGVADGELRVLRVEHVDVALREPVAGGGVAHLLRWGGINPIPLRNDRHKSSQADQTKLILSFLSNPRASCSPARSPSRSSLRFLFSSSILCVRFHSSRYATISLSRDIHRLLFLFFGSRGTLSHAYCCATCSSCPSS